MEREIEREGRGERREGREESGEVVVPLTYLNHR